MKIHSSWRVHLEEEIKKDYFQQLVNFVKYEYKNHTVYPKGVDIFKAFDLCPFDNVKVVIIGQDPYHGPNQANGLAFSVNEGITPPPSLKNIYKEIEDDLGHEIVKDGNLAKWAEQGVLLLNATLTVRAGEAGSHQKKGWEAFTDGVIKLVSSKNENIVFLLWGSYAQEKVELIDTERHFILKSVHPSPLSAHRGFFGCKHFSKTNKFLIVNGLNPIEW